MTFLVSVPRFKKISWEKKILDKINPPVYP